MCLSEFVRNIFLPDLELSGLAGTAVLKNGYVWNKTETKQFCLSFISVLTTALG